MATTVNEKPGNLIMIGIPSKNGLFSDRLTLSLWNLWSGINMTLGRVIVKNRPVDEARNMIVEQAIKANAKYLFFVDDDVIIPRFALLRLLNLDAMVASGIYYTKSQPPVPVILNKNQPSGYKNWNVGDVIDIDFIGMGCCLINMKLFDEIEKPYFYFHPGSKDPDDQRGRLGEDIYFCQKVKDAGHKIWVDTTVQCAHEDFARDTVYFYYHPIKMGAWRGGDGIIHYLPPADSKYKQDISDKADKGIKVCWGYKNELEGFQEADTTKPDEIRKKFKDIPEVKMKGVLEYRTQEEAVALLNCVYMLMDEKAAIEIIVPDVASRLKGLKDSSDAEIVDKMLGYANGRYNSIYTPKQIKQISKLIGFKNIKVIKEGEEIILTAVK